ILHLLDFSNCVLVSLLPDMLRYGRHQTLGVFCGVHHKDHQSRSLTGLEPGQHLNLAAELLTSCLNLYLSGSLMLEPRSTATREHGVRGLHQS
ncbi:hypothetical protein XENOCAPTIV_000253, partial [Xenoophorus captivus]